MTAATTTTSNLITANGLITINKDVQTVFSYIADLRNDKHWRTEITATETNGAPILHMLATEHSVLSKKVPDHINKLRCTGLNNGKIVVYETIADSEFYLKSTREVKAPDQNTTIFQYHIIFDAAVVKHATGMQLPKWLITWKTKHDMKKYLRRLKAELEK